MRRRRESNPCTGLCRPLPKPLGHSATVGIPPGAYRKGIRTLRADDGIRTRDPHLGKVMLYQLSHVRAHLGAFRTVADPAARANSDAPNLPAATLRSRSKHRYYRLAGQRGRRRARGPRPDQPGPAGPQPAAVPRGRRAGRRAHLLRPPGQPGRVELLDSLLRRGLLARERPPSLSRTNQADSGATRFEVTGAGAVTLGSFG